MHPLVVLPGVAMTCEDLGNAPEDLVGVDLKKAVRVRKTRLTSKSFVPRVFTSPLNCHCHASLIDWLARCLVYATVVWKTEGLAVLSASSLPVTPE